MLPNYKKAIFLYTLFIILFSSASYAQNCQGPSSCPPGDDCGVNTYYQDADGDGKGNPSISIQCDNHPSGYVLNNQDCNDSDPNVWDNCCTKRTWYRDADGDGIGNSSVTKRACSRPGGYVSSGGDCNDSYADIGRARTWYVDNDGDGQGADMSSDFHQGLPSGELGIATKTSCTKPTGYVSNNQDCNDLNAGIQQTTWGRDSDGDGFGNPSDTYVGCNIQSGYVANTSDCNDSNNNIHPNTKWYKDSDNDGHSNGTKRTRCTRLTGYKLASELQSINNDCDDTDASVNVTKTWYRDVDNDSFGNTSDTQSNCRKPNGYVLVMGDCDDNNSELNPNTTWYEDADMDGYGSSNGMTRQSCTNPSVANDSEWVRNNEDCNDNDGLPPPTWYLDLDGDGFAGNNSVQQCNQPINGYSQSLDCNDYNPDIYLSKWWYIDNDGDGLGADMSSDRNQIFPSEEYPNPVLSCNPPDNNWVDNNDDCYDPPIGTGGTGQELLILYYDGDSDGYGDPNSVIQSCNNINQYVLIDGDCNDDPNLGGFEINPETRWYQDLDGDGYTSGLIFQGCHKPDVSYVLAKVIINLNLIDCNDENPQIHPNSNWFKDQDQDGFGDSDQLLIQCEQPTGYVLNQDDECPFHHDVDTGCPSFIINAVKSVQTRVANVDPDVIAQYTKNEIAATSTYFDGLGNKSQIISQEVSPNGSDVIIPIEYDSKGRIAKEYLPFGASNTHGEYQPDALSDSYSESNQLSFFQNEPDVVSDSRPYAEIQYDGSPLDRVEIKFSPGQAWKDNNKHTSFSYNTNGENEVYLWKIESDLPIIHAGQPYYAPGQLSKTTVTDESDHKTITYQDKSNRTVLKRSQIATEDGTPVWADTYYIYDDLNRLRFVLPPQAIKDITEYLD